VQTESPANKYVPAAQLVQAEATANEYVPAVQLVQTVEASAAEYSPAEQSEQAGLPTVLLNFPATHALHAPPSGPVKPALQRHELDVSVNVVENDGQVMHTLFAVPIA
jgi:hypothetical protein